MKHKKRRGSDEGSSFEDDRMIIEEEPIENNNYNLDDPDPYDENDLEMTQEVPRTVFDADDTLPLKKKKKEKKKKRDSSPPPVEQEESYEDEERHYNTASGRRNGYRIREIDLSEIPEHLLNGLKRLQPKESDSDGLTSEVWEACKSHDEGGVWILQCPKDVNLSSIISGKRLYLDGNKKSFLGGEEEDNAELTQYIPTNSLGINIKDRQFEAVSVPNEEYREGVALLLPENSSFKLVTAPVQGHIIIREAINDLLVPKLEIPEAPPRELPKGIKERHPIYGSDFTEILKEMERAPVKKKKKKKSLPEPEPEPPRFTKSSLNGYNNSFSNTNDDYNEDESFSKKKKKKKDKYKQEVQEEDPIIETDPYLDEFSYDPTVEESPSKSKKKSKKRKWEEMEEQDKFDNKEYVRAIINRNMEAATLKRSKKSKYHE